jgi:hypothetical protein
MREGLDRAIQGGDVRFRAIMTILAGRLPAKILKRTAVLRDRSLQFPRLKEINKLRREPVEKIHEESRAECLRTGQEFSRIGAVTSRLGSQLL